MSPLPRCVLPLLASIFAPNAFSQSNNTFSTKLKSVAVFRDGYGFFIREGQVKLENGWATTNFVPTAIRGTVWVYSLDPADRIDTLVTTHENKIAFAKGSELKTKLKDKIGLAFAIELNSGQRFEGQLNRLLDDMLLLQVGSAFSAIPYDAIRSVTLVGYPIKVKLNTKDPNKVVTLGIAYLQEGMKWEPSYVLDLTKGKANLSLRATMQNTTEALAGTDVLFVVGSPFIANRGINDMIALMPAHAMKTELKKDGVDREKEVQRGEPDSDAAKPPSQAAVAGEEAGELYYYKKPGLDLAPNDVAMVSIFDADVPIHPTFDWNADGEEVLYILNIKNATKQPLTTGTVFVVEDKRPIGQDNVKYTPAGGSAELHLARGIGLHVERREAEAKRGAPVTIGKTSYIPVT
ncbi:MAG TPA: hypothetical protein VKT78_10580, partial [Fimbriimonadaceae bacterium]|nr:hypothetical protein [Fimbriimonadaceae bacterium]